MQRDLNTTNEIAKVLEVVASEFKNPVGSLSFNIQTIKRVLIMESLSPNHSLFSQIEAIEAKANQMSILIENISDIARTQLSEIPMKKNLTHTYDLISDVISISKKLDSKKIIKIDSAEQCEFGTIGGDKDRLVQVFNSIIAFLLNANPNPGTLKISTKSCGEFMRFVIKDEDFLLESHFLRSLFDKFWHKKIIKLERVSLGLALSKWIVEAHQGNIWVESRKNLGVVFTIELPKMSLSDYQNSPESI